MSASYESQFEPDKVLKGVVDGWIKQIDQARKHKREVFGKAADDALSFYNGPRSWDELMAYSGRGQTSDDDFPDPLFKVSVNKCFEFVSVFGPALYYENPVRTVKPRMPVDVPPEFFADQLTYMVLVQQEQQRAMTDVLKANILGAYLNYTPHEFDLNKESRLAIDEALIKGRGCLWTELYSPPQTDGHFVRTHWDSVDNLLVDPDAPSLDKAKWIAKRCVHPVWEVERDYGLPRGSLRGNAESQAKQADIETNEEAQDTRRRGKSNDLLIYWKIWSKMGIGGRLPGSSRGDRVLLEMFGDYCHVVVAAGVPFLLNLPPHVANDPETPKDVVFSKTAWPTPFWAKDEWPVTVLDFHPVFDSPWPMPHIKAGLGELKAINWITSFLVGHVRNTSRDFVAIKKSTPEEIKNTILHGQDLELIEIDSEHGTIRELVEWLQHPPMNKDIWDVISHLEQNFDKRVGLTELMYGNSEVQLRSAAEANIKNANTNVRPADMAKQVESWQARVAAKEAMCARYHLAAEDVRPVLGSIGAWAWQQYCATPDAQVAARELEYQIEAGSTQKPNKNFEVQQMQAAVQVLVPIFQTYEQLTGDVMPLNNLVSDFAKSLDLDPARYQLVAPRPSQPLPQPGGGPGSVQQEETDNNPVPPS